MNNSKLFNELYKEFYEKFKTKILPVAERLSSRHKDNQVICNFAMIIAVMISFVIFAGIHLLVREVEDVRIYAFAMLPIIIAKAFKYYLVSSFEKELKSRIMPVVCSCLGELKWCSSDELVDFVKIKNSYVVPKHDYSLIDDVFQGVYKGVPYEIVEAFLTKQNLTSKAPVTVFRGVVIRIKMNKNFFGHTVVVHDTLLKNQISRGASLKRTKFEDVEFEKQYDVYTDDEIEARYLLTPTFMERIKDMKQIFQASGIRFAFYGTEFIIALSTNRDLFKLAEFDKSLEDFNQYSQMFAEITSIVELIEHFKLQDKIGL